MLPNRKFYRIDTLELKALVVRKVGHHRAEKYFDQLGKLFTLKISKSDFDKFCIRVIGRENIPLHNQLIRSILKNAILGKAPPPRKGESCLKLRASNERQRNCLQALLTDGFPSSLRKGRSFISRDRKFKDRPSPLGPLEKPQNVAYDEFTSKAQEQQSEMELHSLDSRPPVEVASVEEGEEVEQMAGSPSIQSRSSVTAPLGISMKSGCGRKTLSNISVYSKYHLETCQSSGELPDSRSLSSRLEHMLEKEGLGATVDCINLLNSGLDAYLRRLIESFIGFAGARCRNEHSKQLNSHRIPGSNVLQPGIYNRNFPKFACVSLLDFRLAMELNPQLLGEDWAMQLEKICLRASDEELTSAWISKL